MVVVCSRLATIQRTVTLLVEGVAVFIPILTQSLVATILHSPHRVLLRLVDVEHLSAAYGTSAVWVVLIAYGLHLEHVLATDALVATLIEQYAGVVAVVYYGIAHQFGALCPSWSFHVFLCIAGRHSLYESHAVT